MSGITRKQANLLKKQITKLYGRNYIPLRTGDSPLSIGDILMSKHDITPVLDSSVFDKKNIDFVEGNKVSRNITSSSEIDISTKLKGEAVLSENFKLGEAGIMVQFTSKDQMLLKVKGMRQQSIKNFIAFRKELLEKFSKGEVSAKVYIVRGLVYADQYYLQYSGSKGGNIGFNLDAKVNDIAAEAKADFSFKWKKGVGYHADAPNGGVLAYRVSGVRLKRHLMPEPVLDKILKGTSEADILDTLAFNDRKKLLSEDALEIVDLTDEVLVNQA